MLLLNKKGLIRPFYSFVESKSSMGFLDKFLYSLLVFGGVFAVLRYFIWWINEAHIPNNWYSYNEPYLHFLDFLLFATLTFVIFLSHFINLGNWFSAWFMKRPVYIKPERDWKVAFLTCFVPGKEPVSMLEETLKALVEVDYPHDTWVLDEGNSEDVIDLCNKLGVKHFTRKNNSYYNQVKGTFLRKSKAGNLNAWRHENEHKYEIIAQLDMDHVPHKEYLNKVLGYFSDPSVGFVGMPQVYKNTSNWIARGAAEQTYFFYGPLQQAFYGSHIPSLTGTTHTYRVSAMNDFGGYAPTIAEDYLTGMHFFSNGWKGVYVPEVLTEGEGPTSWRDYFAQQMRWSYGLFEIIFKYNHKHIFKLSIRKRINLFFSQLFYFTGISMYMGIFLTSLYLIFGFSSTNVYFGDWIYYAFPAYLGNLLINLFLHRFHINSKSEPKIGIAGIFLSQAANLIYGIALIKFITGRKLAYKVTGKGKEVEKSDSLKVFLPHIFVFALSLISLYISLIFRHESIIMRFWAGYNVLLMASIVGSAYAKKILIKLQSDVADIYQTATYSVHNNFGKNYRFLWNTYSVGVLAVLVLFFMSGLVYAQTNSFLKSSQLVNATLENNSKKLTSANILNDTLVGSVRASRIYEETAKKGSSYSSLAYHALSRFSTDMNLNLSDEEMVYATNRVATLYATKPLQINMKVDFKYEDLLLYSKESISLPQSKKNSLRNFVKLSYKSN